MSGRIEQHGGRDFEFLGRDDKYGYPLYTRLPVPGATSTYSLPKPPTLQEHLERLWNGFVAAMNSVVSWRMPTAG